MHNYAFGGWFFFLKNIFTSTQNEDRALCTSDFSDMTPLTAANVAFSTLEGRPSAFNFEYSPGENFARTFRTNYVYRYKNY